MGRFVDSIIAYRILRLLVTSFEDTDAFKQGIIDAKGKELKKMSQLNTVQERDAYTLLHRLVFRIKRIINKVPIENKKLLNFAAALSLVKECVEAGKEPINLEEQYLNKINTDLSEEINLIEYYTANKQTLTFKQFVEEVPANNAGTAGVAGFTPDSVGVKVKKQSSKTKNIIFKRGEVKNVNIFKKNF